MAENDVQGIFKFIKWGVIGLIVLIIIFGSFGTVGAGERGIKTRFSAVVGLVPQGLYFKLPFIESVHKMNVKTLTIDYDKGGDVGDDKQLDTNLFGSSKDLQNVYIGIVVNYHVDPTKVLEIYTQYNSVENYQSNVIEPTIRKTVKAISSEYTAEELVTRRAEFNDKVNASLSEQFIEKNSIFEQANITNFEFSPEFTKAIEAKVTAVQNAEASKNKLEQVKFEAQQTIETAKAQAEAIRISAQAINSQGGADYVNLKAVEKWDGKLPTQMIPNATLPFINLK